MKELSIEEKAKAYDELFVKAKTMMVENTNEVDGAKILTKFFPQLAESEDEKIRKEIIDIIDSYDVAHLKAAGLPSRIPKYIAWLEKQGEPTDINPSEFDLRLNKLLKQFKTLPKKELVNCLSFYLNVVQNDGTYREEKQDEQKPLWSEEDEMGMENILSVIEGYGYPKEVEWIKSIKDRIQTKQEWSKENENNILFLTSIIEECFKDKEKITLCGDTVCANFTKEDVIDRLKSIRPQPTWKPSDEQIKALEKVTYYSSFPDAKYCIDLKRLLEQLKAL